MTWINWVVIAVVLVVIGSFFALIDFQWYVANALHYNIGWPETVIEGPDCGPACPSVADTRLAVRDCYGLKVSGPTVTDKVLNTYCIGQAHGEWRREAATK